MPLPPLPLPLKRAQELAVEPGYTTARRPSPGCDCLRDHQEEQVARERRRERRPGGLSLP